MRIDTFSCGTLKVMAEEMIKPLPLKEIKKKYPVDEDGYLKLDMHGLLVEEADRMVVIDPGCADFLPRGISETYGLEIEVPIEESLWSLGITPEQVTDVIFTHLHFDHGSGAFKRVTGSIEKTFPIARYHVSKEHYQYALKPERIEASSFFTKLFHYIDHLYWIEEWNSEWLGFQSYNGHTYGMVVPVINSAEGPVYYITDLVPMEIFLEKEIYSGYDLNPELAVREKEDFLDNLNESVRLIYFHDPLNKSSIYP